MRGVQIYRLTSDYYSHEGIHENVSQFVDPIDTLRDINGAHCDEMTYFFVTISITTRAAWLRCTFPPLSARMV